MWKNGDILLCRFVKTFLEAPLFFGPGNYVVAKFPVREWALAQLVGAQETSPRATSNGVTTHMHQAKI